MAMMLRPPKGGLWHEPDEVVRRLREEFARVDVTRDPVRAYADSVAKSFRASGRTEHADKVDAAKDRGVFVQVTEDNPQQPLILVVLPGIPIMTGFSSEEHLEAVQPLLRRAATSLGYELV